MPALTALRYYDGSDSCGPSPRAAGLPACLTTSSRRCASNHVVHPGIALHATNQRTGQVPDFAMNEQARRVTPPNRVRHPAHRQFASSCSPPRLAATQLPSATGPWLTLARTLTVLVSRLHGRTHSRQRPGTHAPRVCPIGSGMTDIGGNGSRGMHPVDSRSWPGMTLNPAVTLPLQVGLTVAKVAVGG